MPEVKQWDGAQWLNLADEVAVAATTPTDVATELWLDTAAPDPGAPPVGVDYVDVAGDTMTGPLVLSGAPTLMTQAARWADGIPRFADHAARDAAYGTIGGPQYGMSCWLQVYNQQQTWVSTGGDDQWIATGGVMPSWSVAWTNGWLSAAGQWYELAGTAPNPASQAWGGAGMTNGTIQIPYSGFYSTTVEIKVVGPPSIYTVYVGLGNATAMHANGFDPLLEFPSPGYDLHVSAQVNHPWYGAFVLAPWVKTSVAATIVSVRFSGTFQGAY